MSMKKFSAQGFTLVELMTLIALIGVVVAIGIPSYRSMVVTNRIVDTANNMRIAMKLARSEAISRGANTIMCSSTDGSSCSGADDLWVRGWIVGVDLNNDGQIQEATNELLWVHEMEPNTQITITATDPAFNQMVRYSYTGWLTTGDEVGFDICSNYGAVNGFPRREIRASLAGDPQLVKNLSLRC